MTTRELARKTYAIMNLVNGYDDAPAFEEIEEKTQNQVDAFVLNALARRPLIEGEDADEETEDHSRIFAGIVIILAEG